MLSFIILLIVLCAIQTLCVDEIKDSWSGSWFPVSPGQDAYSKGTVILDDALKPKKDNDTWTGNWFPMHPKLEFCDDGEQNLAIDFDPKNSTHHLQFRCLENRDDFKSNFTIHPVATLRELPAAYKPQSVCMNEPIIYPDDGIPLYGASRPIAPKNGEYSFIPPQRWLNALQNGAVVLLYHPCATESQVNVARQIFASCAMRYIITASILPTSQRPIVLLSWGLSLEMSAVDDTLVKRFIEGNNGLIGTREESFTRNDNDDSVRYAHLLVQPAADVPPEQAAKCKLPAETSE